jgi:tripartite ATP-independent transporter DctP family solute receptor
MNKGLAVLFVLTVLATAVFAAGQAETDSGGDLDNVVIRWSDVLSLPNPQVQMMGYVKDLIEERSNGRIEVQLFPWAQLGSSRDALEAVSVGGHEMATENVGHTVHWYAPASILGAPYLFKDVDHMYRIFNSEFGEGIFEEIRKEAGLVRLGSSYYGTRHITTTDTPIRSVADMSGFKIRVPESELFIETARSWGASPTPIDFGELYLALRQNVVNGQENPLPTIDAAKFFEVQQYLVLSGHFINSREVFVNEDWWNGLDSEAKEIIATAVTEGIEWQNALFLQQERDLVASLRDKGMSVIEPDVESFRQASFAYVPAKFERQWGQGAWETVSAIE